MYVYTKKSSTKLPKVRQRNVRRNELNNNNNDYVMILILEKCAVTGETFRSRLCVLIHTLRFVGLS